MYGVFPIHWAHLRDLVHVSALSQSPSEADTTITPTCTEEETETLRGKIICPKSAADKRQNVAKNLPLGRLLAAMMVS